MSGTATALAAGLGVVPGVGGVIALRGVYAAVGGGFAPETLTIFAAFAGLMLAGALGVALRGPEPSRFLLLGESYRLVETVVGTTLARRGGNEADD